MKTIILAAAAALMIAAPASAGESPYLDTAPYLRSHLYDGPYDPATGGYTDDFLKRECVTWAKRSYPANAGWTAREASAEAFRCFELRRKTRDANKTAL